LYSLQSVVTRIKTQPLKRAGRGK